MARIPLGLRHYGNVSVNGMLPFKTSVAPLLSISVTELKVAVFSLRLNPGTFEPKVTCASKLWPASAPLPGVNDTSEAPEPPLVRAKTCVLSSAVQTMVAEF